MTVQYGSLRGCKRCGNAIFSNTPTAPLCEDCATADEEPTRYVPTDHMCAESDPLTFEELEELLELHRSEAHLPDRDGIPEGLRVLADGRVVDEAWDPNGPDPIVYAYEAEGGE